MVNTLRLKVKPDWENLDGIREQSVAFLQNLTIDLETADSISMVVSELLENATKYGSFGPNAESIELVGVEPTSVVVEVTNPLDPDKLENVSRLDGIIQWIRGFQDPFEAYLDRIKEVSSQHFEDDESGLGLVRIAYEGRSILDFVLRDRNLLAVSAVYRRGSQNSNEGVIE
jgi:hypothetical protein